MTTIPRNLQNFTRPLRSLIVLVVCLVPTTVSSQFRVAPAAKDFKSVQRSLYGFDKDYVATIGGETPLLKPGMTVDVTLLNGSTQSSALITIIKFGKEPTVLQTLTFKPVSHRAKFTTRDIRSLTIDGKIFDMVFDTKSKGWALLDRAKHDEVVSERLKSRNYQLYRPDTPEEFEKKQSVYTLNIKALETHCPGVGFVSYESRYFQIYSDLPAKDVEVFQDKMLSSYQLLQKMYGIPEDQSVFCGKLHVFIFKSRQHFIDYAKKQCQWEDQSAEATDIGYPGGQFFVLASGEREVDSIVCDIVWYMTSVFQFRIRSNSTNIPKWLFYGTNDFVWRMVLYEKYSQESSLKDVLPHIRNDKNLGGLITENEYAIDYQPVSGMLVELLIDRDANAFRELFVAVKEGVDVKVALQDIYGWNDEELVEAFGRKIKVPNLKP